MKKYFLIILLFSLLFIIAIPFKVSSAGNYPTIVKDYPELPACKDNAKCRPGKAGFGIPEYIKYIYIFSLGIVGIIGLLAIIMAAFQYVTSVGNPQQAANAKDKIISALLGMILLLGSYVLLKTINPDLLKLKVEEKLVKVEAPAGEEETLLACHVKTARWNKEWVNVGESANLIFTLSEKCEGKTVEILCKLPEETSPFAWQATNICVKQVRPACEGRTGFDPYCGDIYYKPPMDRKGLEMRFPYTFKGQCKDNLGLKCGIKCTGKETLGEICNFFIDKPETIYVEGDFILKADGQSAYPFHVPNLPITVKDLK